MVAFAGRERCFSIDWHELGCHRGPLAHSSALYAACQPALHWLSEGDKCWQQPKHGQSVCAARRAEQSPREQASCASLTNLRGLCCWRMHGHACAPARPRQSGVVLRHYAHDTTAYRAECVSRGCRRDAAVMAETQRHSPEDARAASNLLRAACCKCCRRASCAGCKWAAAPGGSTELALLVQMPHSGQCAREMWYHRNCHRHLQHIKCCSE